MNTSWKKMLTAMPASTAQAICAGMQRGIEKENVRVDVTGHCSSKPHAKILGSALKHPYITTDFSESLLEMVTPVCSSRAELFTQLEKINQWVMQTISKDNEMLWPYSMPYLLNQQDVEQIPLAHYGKSFLGQMKTIYRRGLVQRYGKAMQMIAGIHYNLSWPKELFSTLQQTDKANQSLSLASYQSHRLMGCVRNFLRQQWLCPFLFGVSPACFSGSLLGRPASSHLFPIDHAGAWAGFSDTSLRLSNVGYHNPYQNCVGIDYQDVHHYAKSLLAATQRPMPAYQKLTLQDEQGEWQQLNANILQVENEFYSMIRPKSDQSQQGRPATNLCKHGVAYVELRGLDLDPTTPLGITPKTSAFCDLWLTYLLLQKSPDLSKQDQEQAKHDLNLAVYYGRVNEQGKDKTIHNTLVKRACALLEDMRPLAAWMDEHDATGKGDYTIALEEQINKVEHAELMPAAQLMQSWYASEKDFKDYILQLATNHRDTLLQRILSKDEEQYFQELAAKSLQEQKQLEDSQTGTLADYLQQQLS